MVPKLSVVLLYNQTCFRAVLFRMVPKPKLSKDSITYSFRAVLFRMVPKRTEIDNPSILCFRAVLFRMVPKLHDLLVRQ